MISALMRAFSPTVRAPSEEMLPSILPSTTRSFENLTLPLISTSVLRTLRPLGAALPERDGAGVLLGAFGAEDEALVALSSEAEPTEEMPFSCFCPITF